MTGSERQPQPRITVRPAAGPGSAPRHIPDACPLRYTRSVSGEQGCPVNSLVFATVSFGQRLVRVMDRGYDLLRHPYAFQVSEGNAVDGSLAGLRGHRFTLLVTFRRNGQPVPSPVWCAVDAAGRAYVETGSGSGKVRRIVHDPRVIVAPSTARGKPKGPARRAQARILSNDEWPYAEGVLARTYGIERRIYRAFFPISEALRAYIEIVPLDM